MKKRSLLKISPLIAASLLCSGMAVSSAVSLGVSANNTLGAGVSVSSVCQPATGAPIGVGFAAPSFSNVTGKYTVSTLNLTNIAAACAGQNIKVTVADSANTVIASYTGTVGGTSLAAPLGAAADAAGIANVAIVIYG